MNLYYNKFIQLIFFLFISLNFINAKILLNPQISSNKTFLIPLEINYIINENINVFHKNTFYNTSHPTFNFLHYNYSRDDMTLITERSFVNYKKNNFIFLIGRDYIDFNNELFFSNYSPSLDQIRIHYKKNKIAYSTTIIKLSNKTLNCRENPVCFENWNDNLNFFSKTSLLKKVLSLGFIHSE